MPEYDSLLSVSEPWLQHAIRRNLIGESREALAGLERNASSDPKIMAFLYDIGGFHDIPVTNHRNPDLPIHKLLFLLDIGIDPGRPEIQGAIDAIMAHRDETGVYQSRINVPRHFGGSGEDAFGWCLCDAPLLLRALLMAGADYDSCVRPGVEHLASLGTERGFPCAVSRELGKFRGPGRKDDCCPYATLVMLRLFSEIPQYRDSEFARAAAEVLLSLWDNSLSFHPYLFYMGTDFRKLKAPSSWYDIVSVAETLSRVRGVKNDGRFLDMVSVIESKRDGRGLYTPESVYLKYAGWDFGQKKAPSPYLAYLCERVLLQAGHTLGRA